MIIHLCKIAQTYTYLIYYYLNTAFFLSWSGKFV